MFRKILVPLDGSRLAEAVIPYAIQIARAFHAAVTLFHVEHPLGAPPALTKKGYLESVAEGMEREGAIVVKAVASGLPVEEIISYAEREQMDLIAMSTHGHGELRRLVLGSTADKVLHSTEIPLLLVRSGNGARMKLGEGLFTQVIIPLDGSPLAEEALSFGQALAAQTGLRTTLVQAVAPPSIPLVMKHGAFGNPPVPSVDQEQQELATARARQYLEGVKTRLMNPILATEAVVVNGDPASEIIDLAQRTKGSLVVMSSHGRRGIRRWVWIIGSIADRVIQGSDRPVLLLRSRLAPHLVPHKHVAPAVQKENMEESMTVGASVPASNAMRQDMAILQTADVFSGLPEEQIKRVVTLATRLELPAGWSLGEAGALGTKLYVIIHGNAQLFAPSPIGQVTVRIAGPGESFPLTTLVGSGNLITSAKAMTDLEVLSISRTGLLLLCRLHPEIGVQVYQAVAQVLADRYRKTLAHLTTNSHEALQAADFWANV